MGLAVNTVQLTEARDKQSEKKKKKKADVDSWAGGDGI